MLILWLRAFHLITMVAWFSGLFYLPRLYVYHAMAYDQISIERFKVMEKRLYYYITTPAAILTVIFGLWVISFDLNSYMHMVWLHLKLALILLLIVYHVYLGIILQDFSLNKNRHNHVFYRVLNEIPTLFLIAIILLAVIKPFGTIAF